MAELSELESLIRNIDHIPRQVLCYLDLTSMVRCLRVSKTIQTFIKGERFFHYSKSRFLRELWKAKPPYWYRSRKEHDPLDEHKCCPPHWLDVFDFFENEGNLEDLEEFVWFIKDYFRQSERDRGHFSPLVHAARVGSLKVLQYCLDHGFTFTHEAPFPEEKIYYKGAIVEREYHPDRSSPLVMACRNDQAEAARLILRYANVKDIGMNESDDTDKTAFH